MDHIRIDLPNTNNKWVGFKLANIDTFIIRVKFKLANVNTIHTLTRRTRRHELSLLCAWPIKEFFN